MTADFFSFVGFKGFIFRGYLWVLGLLLCLGINQLSLAQTENSSVSDITVRIDTQLIRFSTDKFLLKDRWVIPVPFRQNNSAFELTLETPLLDPETEIELARSGDFQVVDSLQFLNDNELRMKLRITDMTKTDLVSVHFKLVDKNASERLFTVYLYPYAMPVIQWTTADDELNIGEERVFELNRLHTDLVEANNLWESGPGFDYRLRYTDDRLRLYLLPRVPGTIDLAIPLKARKMVKKATGRFSADLQPLSRRFNVKSGRLTFAALDKNDFVVEDGIGEPIEIQIDKARFMPVRKTFRVESQQENGGKLIAEIYTRSLLGGDRMLCWLRPYGYHRISEGYLYIKDGDEARFITNFNLIERAFVSKVSVLHEGGDWSENLNVNPGERFDIRLEGNGLLRSRLALEGLEEIGRDSTGATDQLVTRRFRIPLDFNKRKIRILLNKRNTPFELQVKEFQQPKDFDFVHIDFGNGYQPITDFNKPVLYPRTIQNVVVRFKPDQIDGANRFFGKQYLSVDINMYNNKKELIEYKRLENIVVCPEENAIRGHFYDRNDCNPAEISVNNLMIRKTQDLPDWSRIEFQIKNSPGRYGSVGFSQKFEIIQQRKYAFDIDVSFPAGLIIKKVGETGLGNLSGISTAIVGQLGFYRPDKIERFYPFKVGAGFIALNAFNFSENTDRDVGLVVLGSVFPTNMSARFSFPLYLGFGYLLKDAKWFYILGPGIQVRF